MLIKISLSINVIINWPSFDKTSETRLVPLLKIMISWLTCLKEHAYNHTDVF